KQVQKIGALGVYERNLRYANEDPLKESNFTEVPSIDVLTTAKQQYNKKYRLYEDYFKELRMFGFFTRCTDDESEDIKGYIQTNDEWPFSVHFFTEVQLDRFVKYCKTEKYSTLHIDATGSVVRQLKHQKDVFFYCMVFQDKNSPIMPHSGALLRDYTAASITSYFNFFRGKIAIRSKVARPAFVVIDFSAALINSVLASKSDSSEFDIEPYLQESDVKDDKSMKQDFLDETDITTNPIIHQSPFNVKACANIPNLRQIIQQEELHKEPSDKFGIAQSSCDREKPRVKLDDLNVKDEWQRRARSNTTNGKSRFYFNDKLSQTNACKLSKGKMNKQIIAFDDSSIPTKKEHSPTNMPVNVDGPLSDSSHNSINDHSLEFSIVSSNAL
ncbi:unnamed protein product, partial [Didymodactylos carnosus]